MGVCRVHMGMRGGRLLGRCGGRLGMAWCVAWSVDVEWNVYVIGFVG